MCWASPSLVRCTTFFMIKIEELNKEHNKNDLLTLSIDFFNEYQYHHFLFEIDEINPQDIYKYFDNNYQ